MKKPLKLAAATSIESFTSRSRQSPPVLMVSNRFIIFISPMGSEGIRQVVANNRNPANNIKLNSPLAVSPDFGGSSRVEAFSKLLNIDFTNKFYNNKICGDIGISPKVVHCIKAEELLVTEFITSKNPVSKSFQGSEMISVLVKMIKTIHGAKPFYRNFYMFTYIYHYMNILKKEGLPKLLFPISNSIDNLGQKLALYRRHLVPCHNDFVVGNIIDNHNQIFLVDFDYSCNNDTCLWIPC